MPSELASIIHKLEDLPAHDGRALDTIAGVLLRQFPAINRLQRRLDRLKLHTGLSKKRRGRRRVHRTDRTGRRPTPLASTQTRETVEGTGLVGPPQGLIRYA